MLTIMLF